MLVREVIAGARRLVGDDGPAPFRRSSDADYVDWVGQAIAWIAVPRPDLFAAQAVMTAEAVPTPYDPESAPPFQVGGNYHRGPDRSFAVIEIIRYRPVRLNRRRAATATEDWYPVDEISYRPLADKPAVATLARPRTGFAPGTIRRSENNPLRRRRGPSEGLFTEDSRPQWARHPQSRNSFFFFPKPEQGALIHIEYARDPRPLVAPAGGQVADLDLPLKDVYYPQMVSCVAWLAESINDEAVVSGRAQMHNEAWRDGLGVAAQARELTDTEASAVAGVVEGRQGGAQ